jgi:hypothetical protein
MADHQNAAHFRCIVSARVHIRSMEKAMNRYWLAAALALCISGISACNRNEGRLPKTDGDQSSQAPRPDQGNKTPAPAGKAASGGY